MENRSFYNEILTEHNVRPEFKHDLPDADIVLEGVNPSCGDDIFLNLKMNGDVIESLEEASALRDIAYMPARVKCAVLGWRTLKEALLGEDADDDDDEDEE